MICAVLLELGPGAGSAPRWPGELPSCWVHAGVRRCLLWLFLDTEIHGGVPVGLQNVPGPAMTTTNDSQINWVSFGDLSWNLEETPSVAWASKST